MEYKEDLIKYRIQRAEQTQKADYDDFVTFTLEEVSNDLENAKKFVKEVKKIIKENPEGKSF
jgi:uncharacterized protein (UPF0332 family)